MKKNKFKIHENLVVSIAFISIILTFFIKYYPFLIQELKNNIYILRNKTYQEILDIPNNIRNDVNSISTNNIAYKSDFIELNGLINKIINKRVVDDIDKDYNVAKLDNGKLAYWNKREDTTNCAQRTIELNDYLKNKNIPLIYIQAPHKISPLNKGLPTGFENYANENCDDFLNTLKENNVDTYDLRNEIINDGLNHYDLFFNTDHHWLPSTGLWASGKIASYLNNHYGFNMDKSNYNINNYSVKNYSKSFLGSMGRRVGKSYGGIDDFDIILPNFDTNFEISIPLSDEHYSGSFEDTMIYYDRINPDDFYNSDAYSAYLGGNYPLYKIKNKNSTNNKKIVLIKDSFSCTMAPYLALSYDEITLVDLRYYTESLKALINDENPDLVLIMYSNIQSDFFTFN